MLTDTDREAAKLLPCPFCGTDPVAPRYECEIGRNDIYAVECPKCDISIWSPSGFSGEAAKQAAADAWNTRHRTASTAALTAEIQRLREWTSTIIAACEALEDGLAAALYALPYESPLLTQDDHIQLDMLLELSFGWKLKPEPDRRRRLVKAGALILAEIERLDRATLAKHVGAEG